MHHDQQLLRDTRAVGRLGLAYNLSPVRGPARPFIHHIPLTVSSDSAPPRPSAVPTPCPPATRARPGAFGRAIVPDVARRLDRWRGSSSSDGAAGAAMSRGRPPRHHG